VDFVAKDVSVVKWSVRFFRTLLKNPQKQFGSHTVQTWSGWHSERWTTPRRAIGKYNFNHFIDEQSINTPVFCLYRHVKRNAKLTHNAIDYVYNTNCK
jgi:hypothetical protein